MGTVRLGPIEVQIWPPRFWLFGRRIHHVWPALLWALTDWADWRVWISDLRLPKER